MQCSKGLNYRSVLWISLRKVYVLVLLILSFVKSAAHLRVVCTQSAYGIPNIDVVSKKKTDCFKTAG